MGVLTKHGYDAAHLMGKFQGQKYAGAGLPLDACSDMFVYCEEVRANAECVTRGTNNSRTNIIVASYHARCVCVRTAGFQRVLPLVC